MNDSATDLAKQSGKPVFYLEKETCDKDFSLPQRFALAGLGILSIPTAPFAYFSLKKYGDPYLKGTPAYNKRQDREAAGKKGIGQRINEFCLGWNRDIRDRHMAEEIVRLLHVTHGSLLAVCGKAHVEGITKNLEERLELQQRYKLEVEVPPSGGTKEALERFKPRTNDFYVEW